LKGYCQAVGRRADMWRKSQAGFVLWAPVGNEVQADRPGEEPALLARVPRLYLLLSLWLYLHSTGRVKRRTLSC
jgi:hypothetical protein